MSHVPAAGLALAGLAGLSLLGACGDDDGGGEGTTTTSTVTTTAPSSTTVPADPSSTTATTEAAPAGDPVQAAAAFVDRHFPGHAAGLSAFRQGDNRSGEVDVLRPAEGGGTANLASTLLLRLDDTDTWQVIGAVNPNVTIEEPENGAEVPADLVLVSGVGRGFESTLVARAFDDEGTVIAESVGTGGAFAEPMPYEIHLDVASAEPGASLVLLVAGGTGLDGDTGEFSAVRVTVGG